jgi:N-dimethylarginine dimethylaminohydrolase
LTCDPAHYRVEYEINPYMQVAVQPDPGAAAAEHAAILDAHAAAGRRVHRIPSVPHCPDMVFTANAAVVRGNRAVLGNPPPQRKAELPYFAEWLVQQGLDVLETPYAFSGQGDALACGDLLLAGYGQRTDRRVHAVLAEYLDYSRDCVIPLRTVGPDWYDLDLAVAVVDLRTLAYFPSAFDRASRARLKRLTVDHGVHLIEVCAEEATRFALNLVSDGATVTMPSGAPRLSGELHARGLEVLELDSTELRKAGGAVRCTALTLDNPCRWLDPASRPPV